MTVKTSQILSNSEISNKIPVKNFDHSTEDDSESENESEFTEILPENLRTKYLSTYKFLSYESMIKKLYCSWCKKAGFINALSKGKKYPLDKTIMQHIEIRHHKLATKFEIRPKDEKNQLKISHLFNLKEKYLIKT